MDIKLGPDGDIDLTGDTMVLVDGADAVKQHWQTRTQFGLGEWFLDQRIGVAWLQTILQKGTPLTVVRDILRKVLSRTPGVQSVGRFDLSLDRPTREATIEAEGLLEPGDVPEVTGAAPFEFVYGPFIILEQVAPQPPGFP